MLKFWCRFQLILQLQYMLHMYSKCSKITNAFLFLFSNNCWLLGLEFNNYNKQNSTTNREDPDQTASEKQSDLGLRCLSMFHDMLLVGEIFEHLPQAYLRC